MKKLLLALGIIGILFSMSFTTLASQDQTSLRHMTTSIEDPAEAAKLKSPLASSWVRIGGKE